MATQYGVMVAGPNCDDCGFQIPAPTDDGQILISDCTVQSGYKWVAPGESTSNGTSLVPVSSDPNNKISLVNGELYSQWLHEETLNTSSNTDYIQYDASTCTLNTGYTPIVSRSLASAYNMVGNNTWEAGAGLANLNLDTGATFGFSMGAGPTNQLTFPIRGLYIVSLNVRFSAAAANTEVGVRLIKNNGEPFQRVDSGHQGDLPRVGFSVPFFMNAGDFITYSLCSNQAGHQVQSVLFAAYFMHHIPDGV